MYDAGSSTAERLSTQFHRRPSPVSGGGGSWRRSRVTERRARRPRPRRPLHRPAVRRLPRLRQPDGGQATRQVRVLSAADIPHDGPNRLSTGVVQRHRHRGEISPFCRNAMNWKSRIRECRVYRKKIFFPIHSAESVLQSMLRLRSRPRTLVQQQPKNTGS